MGIEHRTEHIFLIIDDAFHGGTDEVLTLGGRSNKVLSALLIIISLYYNMNRELLRYEEIFQDYPNYTQNVL